MIRKKGKHGRGMVRKQQAKSKGGGKKNKQAPFFLQLQAIATFVGTVIGAGVLGLPYSIAQSGFWVGFCILALVGIMTAFLNIFVGEIVLKTKEPRQLPGYAAYFLGPWAKHIFAFGLLFGGIGVLLAYLIGIGESFSAIFGGNVGVWGIGAILVMSVLLYRGIDMIKSFELIMLTVMFVIIGLIAVLSHSYIDLSFINTGFDYRQMFVPFGVALFAFGGMSAVQPVREILHGYENSLRKVLIWGSIIPLIIYLFFAFTVVGVTGATTTEVATVGLGAILGPSMLFIGNLFAIFAMGTSYLILGIVLIETFEYDYELSHKISWALTVFVPIVIYILGVHSFIAVLSLVGAVTGGIQGVMVVLMYWKSDKRGNRKPEYDVPQYYAVGTALIVMYVIGIFLTIKGVV